MANTGIKHFDRTVQKTNEWLKEIQEELAWDSREDVYGVTKAVLHAIRDRLPPSEAIQFGAQLPMLLRGVYYEAYQPSWKPDKMKELELEARVYQGFQSDKVYDAEEVIRKVLKVLNKHMPGGEFEHVLGAMPKDIRELFPDEVRAAA